jgi:hypothetical protein
MNVMILKVDHKKAVAINQDGEFIEIEAKKGMRPGAEFALEMAPVRSLIRPIFAAAAVFLVFLLGAAGFAMFSVSGYVDIHINPGVQLAVNPMGYVIKAEAINADGTQLLSHMQNTPFESLAGKVKDILHQALTEGYLAKSEKVLITISDDNVERAENYEQKLLAASLEVVAGTKLPVGITTQKISMKAYNALHSEEAGLDDAQRQKLYESGKWRSMDNRLMIEKAEITGDNTIRLVFSKSVDDWAGVTVLLYDANGNGQNIEITDRQADTWILKSTDLKRGCIYEITVYGLKAASKLKAFLYNSAQNQNMQGGATTNGNEKGNGSEKVQTEKKGSDIEKKNNETKEKGIKKSEYNNSGNTGKVKPSKTAASDKHTNSKNKDRKSKNKSAKNNNGKKSK